MRLEHDEMTAELPVVRVQPHEGANGTKENGHAALAGAHPPRYTHEPPALVLFCFEPHGGLVGRFVEHVLTSMAGREASVHLFTPRAFPLATPGVTMHVMGECHDRDLIAQVHEFARRACNAFLKRFPSSAIPTTLMGFEWSSVPALTLLRGIKNLPLLWSVHSLERQRRDLTSEISKQIEEIEAAALLSAKTILVHDPATVGVAKQLLSRSIERIVRVRPIFPLDDFQSGPDAGEVKNRFHVGPIDPTILYVGDLDDRYGPDLLVKAMPGVLKQHPQARLIVVGGGQLYWPLRVYSRYLLLDHAVRLPGSVEGQGLNELIQAADVVAVPSRDATPQWPILAAWASRRPVLATRQAAPDLLVHEDDSILVEPTVDSCVAGINRLLANLELGQEIGRSGYRRLVEQFGWSAVGAQIEALMTQSVVR